MLLILLMAILWLAGGTSRADQLGQPIVRGAAWTAIMVAVLLGRKATIVEARPVWLFLLLMIALALVQLIPLPPSLWQSLPGRKIFIDAAALIGADQPWRPLSIVPSATFNSLSSLIVPGAILVLATKLSERERAVLPGLVLSAVVFAMLLGLLQFSGVRIDNPFIDNVPGGISGSFANRNHFALFLAFGIVLVPAWAFPNARSLRWRWPAAFALVLLLVLTILATGSRSGIAVGFLALIISVKLAWRPIRTTLKGYPRWTISAVVAAGIGLVALFVLISISADRAVSIHRALTVDPVGDLRGKALPTIWSMTKIYFPVGSGLGDFSTVFKIYEPFGLLDTTYLNRAHDDYLEIVLNAGLPGLLLLLGALAWWAAASWRAWREDNDLRHIRPKLGSSILLLVFVASIFDYPARTPMMMAIITVAALWLASGKDGGTGKTDFTR